MHSIGARVREVPVCFDEIAPSEDSICIQIDFRIHLVHAIPLDTHNSHTQRAT